MLNIWEDFQKIYFDVNAKDHETQIKIGLEILDKYFAIFLIQDEYDNYENRKDNWFNKFGQCLILKYFLTGEVKILEKFIIYIKSKI